MDIDIRDDDNTDAVLATILGRRDLVVKKTAFDIQNAAGGLSAVDTGAQKNSIYVVSADGSTYSNAASEARQASAGVELFPAETLEVEDGSEAIVAVGVVYASVNELTRQAFLTPAAEAQRGAFERAMRELIP